MQSQPGMNLKILLPFKVFAQTSGVSRIIADSTEGAFALLPHRLDCVSGIVPGILTYQVDGDGESYVAVDEGILVKTGLEVIVSVRNAIGGTDLSQLKKAVDHEFTNRNAREQNVRSVMAKIESDFIRRLAEFHHD